MEDLTPLFMLAAATVGLGLILRVYLGRAMRELGRWTRSRQVTYSILTFTSPLWAGLPVLISFGMSTHAGIFGAVATAWIPSMIVGVAIGGLLRSAPAGFIACVSTMGTIFGGIFAGEALLVVGYPLLVAMIVIWELLAFLSVYVGKRTSMRPCSFEDRIGAPSMECWKCEYDLSGLDGERCPECGHPLSVRQLEWVRAGRTATPDARVCMSSRRGIRDSS